MFGEILSSQAAQLLGQAILAVVGVALAVLYNHALKYLRAKLGNEQWARVETGVENVVRYLDQFGPLAGFETNEQKRAYAINEAVRLAKSHGINIDPDTASILVEAFVNKLRG